MTGSPDAAPTPVKALGADAPPKVGDEVEVVVRGKIKAPAPEQDHIGYWFDGSKSALGFWLNCPDVVSVEVLTPPAPTWLEGDVIACKHLHTYIRSSADTWLTVDGFRAEGPCIESTATLLVRAGKAVTP